MERKGDCITNIRYKKETEIVTFQGKEITLENLSPPPPSWFPTPSYSSSVSGIGACISTVTEKGNTVTFVNYSIYSRNGMTAAEYGESARAHWGIENI